MDKADLLSRIARLVPAHGRFDPGRDADVERLAGPLLSRFREQDDVEAFTLLIELTQLKLLQIAVQITRRLGTAVDPEDLVADFMARLFADVRRGRAPVAHFLGMAHIFMRNDARSQLRLLRRAHARHQTWAGRHARALDPAVEAAEREGEAALDRIGALFLSVVSHCFHNLTERDRRVLVAREVDGLSYNEIAAQMGTPRAQVGMIVKRARQRLSRQIGATLGVPWEGAP